MPKDYRIYGQPQEYWEYKERKRQRRQMIWGALLVLLAAVIIWGVY